MYLRRGIFHLLHYHPRTYNVAVVVHDKHACHPSTFIFKSSTNLLLFFNKDQTSKEVKTIVIQLKNFELHISSIDYLYSRLINTDLNLIND